MSEQGIFISFEGIDGAGKSTHIKSLAVAFEQAGRSVVRTREPGGTPLAERLRTMTLHEDMDGVTEALLMFAARRAHVREVIAPALAAGKVVLCERFTDSTFAYQGGGRGVDWTTLEKLERLALDINGTGVSMPLMDEPLTPSLTLWFDLPTELAATRLRGELDRFEMQTLVFFESVRAAYATRMAHAGGRIVRIDTSVTKEQVASEVIAAVRARGWLP
ncbi:MAG: dTMP kinase [Ottowia sp.]|nr:dTMP kinase [Ottowia sp.]